MRQYELWWADLPLPAGRRPVLLLSRDGAYEVLTRVIAVEITTRTRGIPQEVTLGRREGMPQRCVANLDNLHVVDRQRLTGRIGALPRSRIIEVKWALGHTLGWPELVLEE